MADVIVVEDEETEDETPEVVVVDTGGDASDGAETSMLFVLTDRMARVEEHIASLAAVVQGVVDKVNSVEITAEIAEDIAVDAVEAVHELAEDVPDIAEDVADTTTEQEDEPPTSKEHWFYKKWGK